jgi:hypothetical protein
VSGSVSGYVAENGFAQGGDALAGQGGGLNYGRRCRAALGWTAEGGCPYVGIAVVPLAEQVGFIFYYYRGTGFYLA